jgi:hypothetical protein
MTSLLDLYKILNTICFCSFSLGDKDKKFIILVIVNLKMK